MVYGWFVTVWWCAFWLAGLVPITTRWFVDALGRAGWRGWHVASAGAALAVIGGLVAASGQVGYLWGWAFGSALVPVLLVTGLVVHRVEVTWLAGPHGTWTPQESHVWFRPHLAGADLAEREVRHARWVIRLAGFVRVVVPVAAGATLLLVGGGHVEAIGRAAVGTLLAVILLERGSRALRRWRHNRITRAVNGFRPTWPHVAALHRWEITRPGYVPRGEWRSLRAFHVLVTPTTRTPPKPLVTLHGTVGDRDAWVVAGRRPYPLVCVVELAGLDLPLLVLHRERERDGDRLRWRTADRAFARTVVESEEVFAFLGEALPAYADLVLERDTIAMTTVPSVDPEPWRADAMLACLLGLLDRLPAEVLPEHSTTPPRA